MKKQLIGTVNRATRESEIEVEIEKSESRDFKVDTGIEFLNHMIETFALRAGLSISVKVKMNRFKLKHVISEDTGITLGQALREFKDIEAAGSYTMCIDEALAIACINIEGRANTFVERNCEGSQLELVEDMLSADLVAFLEGMSQGLGATIWVRLDRGKDPHHTWEAGFRALGYALKDALKPRITPGCAK